jgi:hypothetical protein
MFPLFEGKKLIPILRFSESSPVQNTTALIFKTVESTGSDSLKQHHIFSSPFYTPRAWEPSRSGFEPSENDFRTRELEAITELFNYLMAAPDKSAKDS